MPPTAQYSMHPSSQMGSQFGTAPLYGSHSGYGVKVVRREGAAPCGSGLLSPTTVGGLPPGFVPLEWYPSTSPVMPYQVAMQPFPGNSSGTYHGAYAFPYQP